MLRAWLKERFREKTLGEKGEDFAERYLRRQGYTILASRNRSPLGEIDLIVVKKRTVVFVEVKTRRSEDKALAEQAVDPKKQARISQAALAYLHRHHLLGHCEARFDVISVIWPKESKHPELRHFEAAFPAPGSFQMHS